MHAREKLKILDFKILLIVNNTPCHPTTTQDICGNIKWCLYLQTKGL